MYIKACTKKIFVIYTSPYDLIVYQLNKHNYFPNKATALFIKSTCMCHSNHCCVRMSQLLLLMLVLFASSLVCWSQDDEQVYKDVDRPSSCKEILDKYPATPSGYYYLKTSKVYCDMDTEHCGSKGWTRVAHVDMSNKFQSCPGNLKLITSPIRSCGGLTTPGCASEKFSTHGISYSKVCGRLKGYQVGYVGAFGPYVNDQTTLIWSLMEYWFLMVRSRIIFGLMPQEVTKYHQIKAIVTVHVLATGLME